MGQSANEPLVSILIIGAMKCGTTQVFHTLAAHPEVNASAMKEPNFFVDHASGNWSRGADWYRSLFREVSGLRMEASTAYTKDYLDSKTALRIRSLCPEAKLIYLIRDPVDRAISHYLHSVTEGRETRPIQEALLDAKSSYGCLSLYHRQLTPYLRLFPRGQILIVRAESLWREPESNFSDILRFLGVANVNLPLSPNRHATSDRVTYLKQFGLSLADRKSWLPEIPSKIAPGKPPGARILGEMLGLTSELRNQVEEYFVNDLRQLHQLHIPRSVGSPEELELRSKPRNVM